MAYLRHCLQELRRYQGDPHWCIAFTAPRLPFPPASVPDAIKLFDLPEYEPLHHSQLHETSSRSQKSR